MSCLGLDIGGANLKLSDGRRYVHSEPFALWKSPERLAGTLRRLFDEAGPCDLLAVTMTGELADCFISKAAGVEFIVRAAVDAGRGSPVQVYRCDGRFVDPARAVAEPLGVAAANWHALAAFAGRLVPAGPALLLDIGSTTCDLVPLQDGVPVSQGTTDTQRLLAGELVYTGVERSPVCGLVRETPYRGDWCPVAQEVFATTRDAYLVTGELAERPDDRETADGRPATIAAAVSRLARMLCADAGEFGLPDARRVAEFVRENQLTLLEAAWKRSLGSRGFRPASVVLSGHGDFLARRLLAAVAPAARIVSLSEAVGADQARAAAAYAVAVLARERRKHDAGD